jgi:fructosamine-3-kinase
VSWASISFEERGGRPVVVKRTTYDARLEADGLRALAAGGVPVPEVYEADHHRLVMERVAGTPDWEGLGRALAGLHRQRAPAFGYPIDNVVGALPQPNGWEDSWPTFFVERRVLVHLDDPAIPASLAERIRRAAEGPLPALLDSHRAVPSLVHGDLWAGNVVDGAYLVDPAVSYSDREVELAFMALFGGIPPAMWHAYAEAWPLDPGWERRRPALQLHHLLVHVRLFDGGYASMVVDRLDALGW